MRKKLTERIGVNSFRQSMYGHARQIVSRPKATAGNSNFQNGAKKKKFFAAILNGIYPLFKLSI